MIFADTHCHLDFATFDSDREDLIERCESSGVGLFIVPGVGRENWDRVIRLSARYDGVHPCIGLHPCFLEKYQEKDLDELESLLRAHKGIVAIGEIGLDLTVGGLERQLALFEHQIDLANQYELPVVMHSRKAHNLILEVIKRKPLVAGGVLHGFSGSFEQAMMFWRAGVYLGMGGVITYERARKTRRAFAQLPLESVVLETDSPDMPLSGKQGGRNTPLNIPLISAVFCSLRPESEEVIKRQILKNTLELFSISAA